MAKALSVKVLGLPELEAAMQAMSVAIRDNAIGNTNSGAILVHKEAVKSIQNNSGSYREYGKHGHMSSPPGQPPNADTGNLASNIRITKTASANNPVAIISSNADYSADLAYGTKYMAPRPFMQPALDKISGVLMLGWTKAINQGLKEGSD